MIKTLFTLGWYGDFYKLKKAAQNDHNYFARFLYSLYLLKHQSYISRKCKIANDCYFPHFTGIHIASEVEIGTGCTIYQHVTLGSNYIEGTKKSGAPTIGNNCLIGAGARLIGGVKIANNVRIGAGCIVVDDVPANSIVVMNKPRIILK